MEKIHIPSFWTTEVDFLVEQVTFPSHLPNGQAPWQTVCNPLKKWGK